MQATSINILIAMKITCGKKGLPFLGKNNWLYTEIKLQQDYLNIISLLILSNEL